MGTAMPENHRAPSANVQRRPAYTQRTGWPTFMPHTEHRTGSGRRQPAQLPAAGPCRPASGSAASRQLAATTPPSCRPSIAAVAARSADQRTAATVLRRRDSDLATSWRCRPFEDFTATAEATIATAVIIGSSSSFTTTASVNAVANWARAFYYFLLRVGVGN